MGSLDYKKCIGKINQEENIQNFLLGSDTTGFLETISKYYDSYVVIF